MHQAKRRTRRLLAPMLAVLLAIQSLGVWAAEEPAVKAAIEVTVDDVNPFGDVAQGTFYYSPVLWAVEKGITAGKTSLTFAPKESCTRGQIVTFLWRAAGQPLPETVENPFTDVKDTAYYYNAVLWAVENGITNGLTSTTFGPDQPCTRGQVVTFLWRYASSPEMGGVDNPFADVREGAYYTAPVLWAVANNITSGVSSDSFAPAKSCTRGEIVTFLYRYLGTDPTNCDHDLRDVAAKAPTCTEPGSIAYYRCIKCGRKFGDITAMKELSAEDIELPAKGHSPVVDPAVAPTSTQTGLTEGSHCSVCGTVLVAQKVVPALSRDQHIITYDVANGDSYLEKLAAAAQLVNSNPNVFSENTPLSLRNLAAAGYRFLGWFDGAGSNAQQIRIIDGVRYDLELYAHWEKIPYKIQFKSSLYLDTAETTYTVDTGAVLPTPKLSNYVFAGWSDEDGTLYKGTRIPAGTTGNIILTANWTSERNKTWTKTKLDDPIIIEDEEAQTILFAYEIGEIQNVPLYTIKDFGYISGDGVTKSATESYSMKISESAMEAYTKAVASATTESSDWTLSSEWNDTTSVNEEYCKQKGVTTAEAETIAKSSSSNWNISSGTSGSTSRASTSTDQKGYVNHIKTGDVKSSSSSDSHSSEHSHEEAGKSNWGLNFQGGWSAGSNGGLGALFGANGGAENSDADKDTLINGSNNISTSSHSEEYDASNNETWGTTDSTTDTASWNSSSSFGGSATNSKSKTTSKELSESISESYGYGQSHSSGGGESTSQGLSSTQTSSEEYASSVTYSTETGKEVTSTWTTQSTKPGYHRWVVAGTAHVFAVVGYNLQSKAYFVYTYSVMDDETHEFEDYSYTTAAYNDEQNGVIPFEVPYEVADYVASRTCYSKGLKVDQATGTITGYTGTDTCVVIPEYMNVGGGDVVKITGISSNAFRGNTEIKTMVLSDFIEAIPDRAFEGCSSFCGITGGSVTSIGDRAFYGCTEIENCGVSRFITHLGEDAFKGVERLLVDPSNRQVLEAAMHSGAKNLELYVNWIDGGMEALEGLTLTASEDMDYFAFNGYGLTFTDLTIVSDAAETVINKANFVGKGKIPLRLSSPEVILNQVTVNATGLAMVLSASHTNLGLQSTMSAVSENENTVLTRDLTLYDSNENVDGKLAVQDKILVCGGVEGESRLTCGAYEKIDDETFERMLHAYTLYFDPSGGACGTASREVPNGTPVGALPEAALKYNTFTGWYLSDGTRVTESTVFSDGLDRTVYARYAPNTFTLTLDAGEGTCDPGFVTVTCGQPVGALPKPERDFYNFDGWYTDSGSPITADTVFETDEPRTAYARWYEKDVSAWTLASEVPANAAVVDEKWTYTLRTYKESTDTSMSGYTQYDSYWVKSGSGSKKYASFPGGFDTSHSIYTSFAKSVPYTKSETATTKREVSNSWTGYVYWHWMYNVSYANVTNRAISSKRGTFGANNFAYIYFYAFTSSVNCPYLDNLYCNSQNVPSYNCASVLPETGKLGIGTPRFLRFDYYTSTYTDYYKMFKYYRDTNEESSTAVSSGNNISNVQHWVKFREK